MKNKKLLKESGIRDINALAERYPKAEIYFHQDLDGVTTAIAMREYLESYGIDVVDAHIIQYGDKEFAVKKNDGEGDTMPVLVDFAHGKVMFKIHTDHHDRQAGADETKSTSFRPSRSNVETISQIVSPKDVFYTDDLSLISTVDSANYAVQNISVDQVINYLFRLDKDSSATRNKMMMGLVANKLLLAFKNKPGFLEELVMTSTPSLLNILLNIKRIMVEKGYASTETLQKNKESYIEQMKSHPNVKVMDNIIVQYGGGKMTSPGSYDRYTPFKNNPEADFLVIAWPLGLVQASCNPFKKERELKGVNLGEIAQEVLSKWEGQLKQKEVSLSTIKWISESSKDFTSESVGFTFKDFVALYGDKYKTMEGGKQTLRDIGEIMEMPFTELSEDEKEFLDGITINAWDLIQAGSGGHRCITNVSNLNYLGRSKRPPEGKYKYDPNKEDAPYVKFTKMIQAEFVRVLQEKISSSK
jgi:hypothetical protein